MRCNVCSSPQIVKDKSYYDVQGYHYGLCEHSEDLGDEMECPDESTACGKLTIRVSKAKVESVLEEVKHLLPYSYTRRDLSITKFKQSILRERGRGRPSEGIKSNNDQILSFSIVLGLNLSYLIKTQSITFLEEVRDRLERNGMIEGYIRGCVHVFSNQRCIKDPLVCNKNFQIVLKYSNSNVKISSYIY